MLTREIFSCIWLEFTSLVQASVWLVYRWEIYHYMSFNFVPWRTKSLSLVQCILVAIYLSLIWECNSYILKLFTFIPLIGLALCFGPSPCCMMNFLPISLVGIHYKLADKMFVNFWIHAVTEATTQSQAKKLPPSYFTDELVGFGS